MLFISVQLLGCTSKRRRFFYPQTKCYYKDEVAPKGGRGPRNERSEFWGKHKEKTPNITSDAFSYDKGENYELHLTVQSYYKIGAKSSEEKRFTKQKSKYSVNFLRF